MKNKIRKLLLLSFLAGLLNSAFAQNNPRWSLVDNGNISWEVKAKDSHVDNIEMSGFYMSAIVHYGVEDGQLKQKAHLVFPMLRTIPNDTHASLAHEIDRDDLDQIKINGKTVIEYPSSFQHKGILSIRSITTEGIEINHQLFPSTDQPVFIDQIEIVNTSSQVIDVDVPKMKYTHITEAEKGVTGAYVIKVISSKQGIYNLNPNETLEYALIYSARSVHAVEPYVAADFELEKRKKLVSNTYSDLVFESPDKVINTMFTFAKLRAVESVFHTNGGLMHAPGGGRYYAAIWANDQAEYANPFFPFLGNLAGNESAINSFRTFAKFMNEEYRPIPSSIIAEGIDFWNGAGDRGDMAMIAYGASRFSLAYGDKNTAKELWPLIEWCLEFCRRKVTKDGVVASDSDELEGRFPAGKTNLNTSCLYYDALVSTTMLGEELDINQEQLDNYKRQSGELKQAIEKFFGATMDGFKTYKYFENNNLLRAWIATPLTVHIFDRSEGTIEALFSDRLWTPDGLASQASDKQSEESITTFWDRATLYGFRGALAAGETKRSLKYLKDYSERRLLGEHVPYPVEAYPEGNQRHLSAESALYCRVITEGLFGIRPTGFNEFSFSPKLPDGWNEMALRNIKAFNQTFDIEVKKEGSKLLVKVFSVDGVYLSAVVNDGQILKCEM